MTGFYSSTDKQSEHWPQVLRETNSVHIVFDFVLLPALGFLDLPWFCYFGC